MNVRKRLRKAAEEASTDGGKKSRRKMRWFAGVLCYADTNLPVPNVRPVPKPKRTTFVPAAQSAEDEYQLLEAAE